MLHRQTRLIYNFDTFAPAAEFPRSISSAWVWPFACLEAFPLDHIISRSLALFASSCVPLDPDFFSAYVPVYCIREASWAAFFVGGTGCWEVSFHIPLSPFPFCREHTAWRYGGSLRAYHRYTNLRVRDGLVTEVWHLRVFLLALFVLGLA